MSQRDNPRLALSNITRECVSAKRRIALGKPGTWMNPGCRGKLAKWTLREWSRWEAGDVDGETREGEAFGLKLNQPVRRRWESRRTRERE